MGTRVNLLLLGTGLTLAFPSLAGADVLQNRGKEPIKILITGFGPFGKVKVNPTGIFAHSLGKDLRIGDFLIRGLALPVDYKMAWPLAKMTLQQFEPDFVLSLGLAESERGVRLETQAKNEDRGEVDVSGNRQIGPIEKNGVFLLPTHLPTVKIMSALDHAKIPNQLSEDAGGYLCNHLFYRVMYYAKSKPGMKAAFVHVPHWPAFDMRGKTSGPDIKQVVETVLRSWTGEGTFAISPVDLKISKSAETQ